MPMTEKREDPAKDFLCSYRGARLEVVRCESRLEQMRARCEKLTQQMSSGGHGGNHDLHGDASMTALADLSSHLDQLRREAAEREVDVEKFIELLPSPDHRAVLSMRYAGLMTWPAIRVKMEQHGLFYSERQMFRLHGDALQAARETWADTHPGEGIEGGTEV